MKTKQSPWNRDWAVWIGLALLPIGLLFADCSFAAWRNDGRHFPDANGVYHQADPGEAAPPLHDAFYKGMAIMGLSMMAVSVVLLNRRGS